VSDPTEAITQAIRYHGFDLVYADPDRSRCAYTPDGYVCAWAGSEHGHAAHVAEMIVEALTANGWALVQLPEPTSTRYEGDDHEPVDRKAWKAGHDFEASVWYPGEVQLSVFMDVWEAFEPFSAADARALAAALLAAAKESEQ